MEGDRSRGVLSQEGEITSVLDCSMTPTITRESSDIAPWAGDYVAAEDEVAGES